MGLGSPCPHLHRDWAHTLHICTETGSRVTCTATGITPPYLQQDWSQSVRRSLLRAPVPQPLPSASPAWHARACTSRRQSMAAFRRSARGRSAVMLSAPRRSRAAGTLEGATARNRVPPRAEQLAAEKPEDAAGRPPPPICRHSSHLRLCLAPSASAPRAIMPPLRQPQAAAPYSAIAEVLRARRIPVRM